MKKITLLVLLVISAFALQAAEPLKYDRKTLKAVHETLDFAVEQSLRLYESVREDPKRMPRSYYAQNDSLILCPIRWWASGFFPGSMWYLYEHTGREDLRQIAEQLTERMNSEKDRTDNHDIGFAINCTYGNAYRLTHKEAYRDVIITAARNFSTRFNPTVGCTRSWNPSKKRQGWGYIVIIDNMMNLELLTVASQLSGDDTYEKIARSHADVTMKNHYRPDYSSYHVVCYDEQTGKVTTRKTHQGYADESAWSRGQAWGLYGYMMMYRQTGDKRYLEHAVNIGKFLMNHPNLPKDKIPYWDYDTPAIPNTPRDASAGALMASAYVELATMCEGEEAEQFLRMAEHQLRSLCSPKYRSKAGENGNFLITHSTGFFNSNYEVDAPISYSDYYFIEAMMRYKRLCAGESPTDNTAPSEAGGDRAVWVASLDRVARPVMEALAKGELRATMPIESQGTLESRLTCTHLEAFGRVMVGITPWLALGEDSTPEGRLRGEYIRLAVAGLKNAVDPASPDRLNFNEGRQPLVDAAFLAQGLLRAPIIWERSDEVTRQRLLDALRSSRVIKPSETNWLFFSAMVEAALKEFGSEWEYERIAYAFKRFTEWYKGDGFYGDGPAFHLDYYNSFVIQPMMMTILDVLKKHNAPDASFADKQVARYSRYAAHQERMISPEGTYPITGRSIAYRFGAFQALSDAAYRHLLPKEVAPAAVRSALTKVIARQTNAPETFDGQGWLHVGICGHQPSTGERYISTGSLYLCCGGYIALGLPATDPFWSAPAELWTNAKAWSGIDIPVDKALKN